MKVKVLSNLVAIYIRRPLLCLEKIGKFKGSMPPAIVGVFWIKFVYHETKSLFETGMRKTKTSIVCEQTVSVFERSVVPGI